MSEVPSMLSSVQILAKLDQAMAESGLTKRKTAREPLPLLREMISDWYASYGVAREGISDAAALKQLAQQKTVKELKEALRTMYEDVVNISTSNGSLTPAVRQQLEQEHKRLSRLLDL